MMMKDLLSIAFLIIGVVFIVSEFGIPTNFQLFSVGVGFISISIMTFFGLSWIIQLPVAITVAMSVVLIAYKLSRRNGGPPPTEFTPLAMRGKVGKVVKKGEDGYIVKVNEEEWRAVSEEPLEVGDDVIVEDIFGIRLKVRKRR